MLMQINKEVFELFRAYPPFVGKRNSNFNYCSYLYIRAAAQVRVLQFSQSVNTSNYSSIAENKFVSALCRCELQASVFSKASIQFRAEHDIVEGCGPVKLSPKWNNTEQLPVCFIFHSMLYAASTKLK